jgi:hypothetical protein
VSTPDDDPASVSEQTLRVFEADMQPREDPSPEPRRRTHQGATILLVIGGCIAAGAGYAIAWFL